SVFVIGNDVVEFVILLNIAVISPVISIFGIASNIINIIVFARHGFKDSVNVSLVALAVSDVCSLVPLLWLSVVLNPAFSAVPFVRLEVQYLTASWPHTCFARITSWVTAYIMLERCLCIIKPLTVRTIITPRRVRCIMGFIFAAGVAVVCPTYATAWLGWRFSPADNRTLLGLVNRPGSKDVIKATVFFNNTLSPLASFVVVGVCLIIIVSKLKEKAKWREASVGGTNLKKISGNDRKAIKMLAALSVMFITSVAPNIGLVVWYICDKEFTLDGAYRNLFNTLFTCTYVLEASNSSFGVVVYFTMNARYRATFMNILGLGRK
ncbi:unnamed protein product, partial [Lymnaea stagnalis]